MWKQIDSIQQQQRNKTNLKRFHSSIDHVKWCMNAFKPGHILIYIVFNKTTQKPFYLSVQYNRTEQVMYKTESQIGRTKALSR